MESALRSAFYMRLHLYDDIDAYGISTGTATAIFFLVRENAYASMFRYNSRGSSTFPTEGSLTTEKIWQERLRICSLQRSSSTLLTPSLRTWTLRLSYGRVYTGADDFILLDPPYDREFSTYTQDTFDKSDQERLAHYLLNGCMAKFMLVIKITPTNL